MPSIAAHPSRALVGGNRRRVDVPCYLRASSAATRRRAWSTTTTREGEGATAEAGFADGFTLRIGSFAIAAAPEGRAGQSGRGRHRRGARRCCNTGARLVSPPGAGPDRHVVRRWGSFSIAAPRPHGATSSTAGRTTARATEEINAPGGAGRGHHRRAARRGAYSRAIALATGRAYWCRCTPSSWATRTISALDFSAPVDESAAVSSSLLALSAGHHRPGPARGRQPSGLQWRCSCSCPCKRLVLSAFVVGAISVITFVLSTSPSIRRRGSPAISATPADIAPSANATASTAVPVPYFSPILGRSCREISACPYLSGPIGGGVDRRAGAGEATLALLTSLFALRRAVPSRRDRGGAAGLGRGTASRWAICGDGGAGRAEFRGPGCCMILLFGVTLAGSRSRAADWAHFGAADDRAGLVRHPRAMRLVRAG